MAKDLRFALLLDCYGAFLTSHQEKMMEQYYCEDLSLSEIATLSGITRQGVHDVIKRSEQLLTEMEQKLRFAEKLQMLQANYASIAACLDAIAQAATNDSDIQKLCNFAQTQVKIGVQMAEPA